MKFRSAFAVFVCVLFLNSCSTEKSPREFADKYIAAENDAWGTGDLSPLEALEDPEIVYHMPGMDLKGWKAHADYITAGRATVSDLKQNWKYLSGEGDHFAVAYGASVIVKADEQNPATSISNDFLFVVRTSNGKVVEVWMNGSTASKPAE
jgi:ketosteroid isomerase-like protein